MWAPWRCWLNHRRVEVFNKEGAEQLRSVTRTSGDAQQ